MLHAVFLAHQGGWDEIAFVLLPLLVFTGLLLVAKRRVDRGEIDKQGDSGDIKSKPAPTTQPEPRES